MKAERLFIGGIPAILWGEEAEKAYIFVHGKLGSKEAAAAFSAAAGKKGFQTLSFDLPQHGERAREARACDIWNGMEDLAQIGAYALKNWPRLSLFANSLGAYFSLQAYGDMGFERALFLSPIVDMEYLIGQMFARFGVTEAMLAERGEIPTPVEPLSYRYYRYVLEHPVRRWPIPTRVLYGGRDDMQSRAVMEAFCKNFCCALQVSENSRHPFMEEADKPILERWYQDNI